MTVKTIAVIGASGGIGSQVVKHALQKGFNVRALVRSADKFQAKMQAHEVITETPNLEMVVGCASDKQTLCNAIQGQPALTTYDSDSQTVCFARFGSCDQLPWERARS
jgi:uncharacterized protein YbjT (DUF2867 family)